MKLRISDVCLKLFSITSCIVLENLLKEKFLFITIKLLIVVILVYHIALLFLKGLKNSLKSVVSRALNA